MDYAESLQDYIKRKFDKISPPAPLPPAFSSDGLGWRHILWCEKEICRICGVDYEAMVEAVKPLSEKYFERKISYMPWIVAIHDAQLVLLKAEAEINDPATRAFLAAARKHICKEGNDLFAQEFYPPEHIYHRLRKLPT
jgi:hypothetical protein